MAAEARKGKIARLPLSVRLELNRRMRDGATGAQLCGWLESLPAVEAVMVEQFHGEPVKPQNLSEWRAGGYREWLREEERVEQIRALSEMSYRLAQAAGGNMSEGAAAVAAAKIQTLLDGLEGEDLAKIVPALTGLRMAEIAALREKNQRARLEQNDRALSLEERKFQRQTADLFLKWFDQESARRIAEGKETKQVKMDKLIHLMFGAPPPKSGATPP